MKRKRKLNLDRLLLVLLIPLFLISSTMFIIDMAKKTPILPVPYYIGSYQNMVLVDMSLGHEQKDDVFAFSPVKGNANDLLTFNQLDLSKPNETTITYQLDKQTIDVRYIVHPNNAMLDPQSVSPIMVADPSRLDVLVNRYYALASDYIPQNLVNVDNYLVRSEVQDPLKKLMSDANAQGVQFFITSGYRSYEFQSKLFNDSLANVGLEETIQYVAFPGRSEHQTGLAVDMLSNDTPYLSAEMGSRPSGIWLQEHAHEYGFIIRYESSKSNVTGYGYEPWHLRYLGVELATTIKQNNWSYEEYMLYTQNNASYINGIQIK